MTTIFLAACEVAPPADEPWWAGYIAALGILLFFGFIIWVILR